MIKMTGISRYREEDPRAGSDWDESYPCRRSHDCGGQGKDNAWPGQVSAVDLMGARVRVRIDGTPEIPAEVPPSAVDELAPGDGGGLGAAVSPSAVTVYPP
jgi:hypothetical protein